jgi:predicted transcriptional regulator
MSGSTKQKVLELVEQLPPEATLDDVMERLYFLSKVERGLDQLAAGRTIPHDEVKRRFQK